jgi:hypothetical protein
MAVDALRAHLEGFYEAAVFGGQAQALEDGFAATRHAQAVTDLSRGKLLHARLLAATERPAEVPEELNAFEAAAEGFAAVGDERGRAEALLWQGLYFQVVRGNSEAAALFLTSAQAISATQHDDLTLSYAERHLGFHDWEAGRDAAARAHLQRSVELRRGLDWPAGTAAALLALAEFDSTHGDPVSAAQLIAEARALATGADAQGVLAWIDAENA